MQLFDQQTSESLRAAFPALHQTIYGHPLIYLDNAATTLTHTSVIKAMDTYYRNQHANPHRSAHYLANKATDLVEEVREKIGHFLHASYKEEVIFTAGATAAFNLVADSYRSIVNEGDEIVLSALEHHSNWLPWERLAQEKKCRLRVIPLQENGVLDLSLLSTLINTKTRIVAITYISHVTGEKVDLPAIIQRAHQVGADVIVDAVQAAPHTPIDVQKLDADFLIFSGHKLYGPTGIGVLYGKKNIMSRFPPYQLGGGTVAGLQNDGWQYEPLPHRLEAGTLPVASIVGLGAAIDFLGTFQPVAQQHTAALIKMAIDKLDKEEGITVVGGKTPKVSLFSFSISQKHSLDIGLALNTAGIAVRTGQHCALPALKALHLEGTVRVSCGVYNTAEEMNTLLEKIKKLR